MANETIAPGGTLTLSQPLTGGTNIDFINTPAPGGLLIIDPAAITTTTQSTGASGAVSGTLGGAILNFGTGDQVSLQTINSDYAAFDVATTAASANTQFDNDFKFSAESGIRYYIENDGVVTPSTDSPISTVDANTQQILDEIARAVLGTAASFETVTLAPYLTVTGSTSVTEVMVTTAGAAPCFAAGTHILTTAGEVAVETMRAGAGAITFAGEVREVTWIGRRQLDLARHPRPDTVRPVVIEPDALGDGVPARRLRVSPDHALYLDGLLVPAKDLVNGVTIYADAASRRVTYFHVELACHDILFAEGAAAESYLDTGNRAMFEAPGVPLLLHPDMQARREREGCAPFCAGGEALAAIRARLAGRRQASAAFFKKSSRKPF